MKTGLSPDARPVFTRPAIERAAWLTLVALSLALFFAAIPIRYDQLSKLSEESLPAGWTKEQLQAALEDVGIPAGLYASAVIALNVLLGGISSAVALIIFWRRSRERAALLFSLWMIAFSTTQVTGELAGLRSVVGIAAHVLTELGGSVLLPIVFLTFPDGRFVPRWTRWLGLAWILGGALLFFLEIMGGSRLESPTPMPIVIVWVGLWFAGVAAQLYRYRRVSTPAVRQQTRWVVLGMAGAVLSLGFVLALSILFPRMEVPGPEGLLYGQLLFQTILTLGFMLIPLSIGVAVLRYRLWDIDLLVRRTLVYGLLTGLLALAYFGAVAILQSLFQAASGQTSPLAIVLSTLVIAVLFRPIRNRVQDLVDRRFYRRKFDASQTLAAFAATARDEVDLEALSAELLRVVQETMEPDRLGLWLAPGKHE